MENANNSSHTVRSSFFVIQPLNLVYFNDKNIYLVHYSFCLHNSRKNCFFFHICQQFFLLSIRIHGMVKHWFKCRARRRKKKDTSSYREQCGESVGISKMKMDKRKEMKRRRHLRTINSHLL